MIRLFLPPGLKGIMVASILAAFMSTIDTHLNWGTSYIINDFYKPFISSSKSNSHYIIVSRAVLIVLMTIALLFSSRLSNILMIYKYLSVIFGAIATVMIARWYWWRVNPYSEISAIIASLVVGNLTQFTLQQYNGTDLYAARLVITVTIVTCVWVSVTFLTSGATPGSHVIEFYRKMRIPGIGWERVRQKTDILPNRNEFLTSLIGWACCVMLIYASMLGIGKFLLRQYTAAAVCALVSIISGCVVAKVLKKMKLLTDPTFPKAHQDSRNAEPADRYFYSQTES